MKIAGSVDNQERATKSFRHTPSMILVFLTHKKNLSFQFCDLVVENSITRGVLAKFEPTLYATYATFFASTNQCQDRALSTFHRE